MVLIRLNQKLRVQNIPLGGGIIAATNSYFEVVLDLSAKVSSMADETVPAGIGCNGWNAEPNDGRNLKPTGGLNMADDGDRWSVSLDFRQT